MLFGGDDTMKKTRRTQAPTAPAQSIIVRPNDITAIIGLSRRQADRLEAAGAFPRKVRLGENSAGWLMTEVSAWVAQRAAERDAGKSKR